MVSPAARRRLFRDLNKSDDRFAEKMAPFLGGLYSHYFRVEVEGQENIQDKKALYVGNHNGLITFEVVMLFYFWWKEMRHLTSRRALGLAHGIALHNPLFRWICPKIGAIPADPIVAREAFERDFSLMVYPGGEKEAFRKFSERKHVDFFQRKGWIRLALDAKVPIVPVISCGAQESYVILHRGEELAEALGLKEKFRLHGLPITFRAIFFMWCMVTGIFTFFPLLLAPAAFASIFVPLPVKMKFKFLPEIDVCSMVDPNLSSEENHQQIYDHVLEIMRTALSTEYDKRRFPFVG